MIITLSKVRLLEKLRNARELEIKRCEKLNATIDDDFERDRKKMIDQLERALQKVRTTTKGFDTYERVTISDLERRAKAEPKIEEYDHAIYLLQGAKENEVRIDTNRDKYGLDKAIRDALGIKR